ncbi:hypothetical protein B296_00006415 [Ensete ventricosum]|uniref:Uncharacterized protein n=1 Tax=Ensete ventricosum TaxID=4639 RepID=A0A427BBS2_ENSVE|nr:hypothetical protein B296_00006415 [Ensete ventricosum]
MRRRSCLPLRPSLGCFTSYQIHVLYILSISVYRLSNHRCQPCHYPSLLPLLLIAVAHLRGLVAPITCCLFSSLTSSCNRNRASSASFAKGSSPSITDLH